MQNSVFVRVLHRVRQLHDQFHCGADRHWFTFEDRIELSAFDQAHAEVASAIAFADFVNRNDAGMVQSGGRFRFATESFHVRFRRPMTQRDHLQCDRSEEHTSELQSRPHLVCRLLLEKKKNIIYQLLSKKNKKKKKQKK